MTDNAVPTRDEIPERYTWNAPSVFECLAAWEAEIESFQAGLGDFARFQGHLHESSAILADALHARDELLARVGRYYQKLWIGLRKEMAYPWGRSNPQAALEAAGRIRHGQGYHR